MQKTKLLHFNISTGSYSEFVAHAINLAEQKISSYICVANVHMFIEAYTDRKFLQIVNNADVITPDGKPLCWALKVIKGIVQPRVCGMDFLPSLLEQAQEKSLSVFFYGGTDAMLEKTNVSLKQKYPHLSLAGFYSPPFRQLTSAEEDEICNKINASNPNLVFVVLGCPKQEKWMASMKGKINAVMIGIGGALPVFVGMQKRAPKWMQDYGLEWLFRLIQEPNRLWKRYLVTNSLFIYLIIKAKFNLK